MAETTVLDLTTERERLVVRIDHVAYQLRTPHDFTLAQFKELERLAPRVNTLLGQDALSKREEAELEQLLDRICRIAVVAPPAVHDTLDALLRVQIFKVFTDLSLPTLEAARAALEGGPRRIPAGTVSSPGSPGSTASARSRGSHKSRSASSRPT